MSYWAERHAEMMRIAAMLNSAREDEQHPVGRIVRQAKPSPADFWKLIRHLRVHGGTFWFS